MAKYSGRVALLMATLAVAGVAATLGTGVALAQPVVGVVSCDGTNVVLSVPDLGITGPVIVEIAGTIEGRYSVTGGAASAVGPMPLPLPTSFPAPVEVLSNDLTTDLADGSVTAGDCSDPPVINVSSLPPWAYPIWTSQCTKAHWKTYNLFRNQGDCTSFVSTLERNLPALAG